MQVRILRATESDIPVLRRLVSDEFSYLDQQVHAFEEKIQSPDFWVFKIIVDGLFAGFCEVQWLAPWTVRINGLGIVSDFRKQGLGTLLLDFCVNELRKGGVDSIELLVASDNEVAKKMYVKAGFVFDRPWHEHIQQKQVECWKLELVKRPFSGVC
ncbi:MAG: N-acetyltransferase [Candidatus Diapherotrites archaeon]|nr:N-acetyltransferase [Candidatus Diapherotrites archaeon]